LALRPLILGIGSIEFCLIRARVNRDQKIALLDRFALLEMDLVEITADARPDFDGCRRFQPPDVFVPLDDFALDGLDNGHDGRRWRWLGMFSATREQRADQKDQEREQAVRLHGTSLDFISVLRSFNVAGWDQARPAMRRREFGPRRDRPCNQPGWPDSAHQSRRLAAECGPRLVTT